VAKAPSLIRSKARAHTDAAIRVLVEIMSNRSAPHQARVAAATEVLNRGLGKLVDPQKFEPVRQEFYVYSIHDKAGRLVYIGKGADRRHLQSAQRLSGRSRVRAEFSNEKDALRFERRLIRRFRPRFNAVYNRPYFSAA
jgi:hypothetical protein